MAPGRTVDFTGFVHEVQLERAGVPSFDAYPFAIPAVRTLDTLELDPKVTFLIGDNGSGKSTLIEAIAVAAGFNAKGGSKNFSFSTRRSESELHKHLRLVRIAPARLSRRARPVLQASVHRSRVGLDLTARSRSEHFVQRSGGVVQGAHAGPIWVTALVCWRRAQRRDRRPSASQA